MELALVERARRGDHDAFTQLAYDVSDQLYAVARRILGDATRAEDALQQALIAIWQDLPGLRESDRFEAWAYRVLVRCCYREASQHRRWTASVKPVLVPRLTADEEPDVHARDELERAFRHLAPEQRAVLVLGFYLGLDTAAIAGIMGIPAGTVASRRHYALRTMRAALEADARSEAVRESQA